MAWVTVDKDGSERIFEQNLEGLLKVYGFQPTMIIEIDSMTL